MRLRHAGRTGCAALTAATMVYGGAALPASAATGPALTIDVTAGRGAISPDIYGINSADPKTAAAMGVTATRAGGNTMTRFNYLNDTYNTGSDYYFENIPPAASGFTDDGFLTAARTAKLKPVWTLPMSGWVANRATTGHPYDCGFPTSRFPTQDSVDQWDTRCGNGSRAGKNIVGAVPSDTTTAIGPDFVRAQVAHYVSRYGDAAHGGVPIYQLDNEPALWSSTHRDVHPAPLSYDEQMTRTTQYAAAVKAADPTAAVLGPGDWGWCAWFYSAADGCTPGADRAAHGNADLAPWYLAQLKAYETKNRVRLLDYFDEHYYPQAPGVALSPAGAASTQALRLRTTRSLWDPAYADESWIHDVTTQGVALIPRMRNWVAGNYPGTKLAVTEYNFGGLESLNGALTQADVLGIFGREGVDLATLWSGPKATEPGAFAFRAFRNYDGKGGAFGETRVEATSKDQSTLSVYAAQRAGDGAVTAVVVNKSAAALTSPVALTHFAAGATAQVWRYSAADLTRIVRAPDVPVLSSGVRTTFPASSITVLVFPKAGVAAPAVAESAASYSWRVVVDAKAAGGRYVSASAAGASASYRFTGSSVTWYSVTGPAQGAADVYVDGKLRDTLVDYAPTVGYRTAHTVRGLPNAPHVLRIVVRGQREPRSRGTAIAIDAVRAGAGAVNANPSLTMSWPRSVSAAALGGAYVSSGERGAALTITASGTA
ncbi:MAG: hypothetical protein QOG49_1256, partial [Frankiaceae bacterium]|nr:hypothetical protein [Frankiaceae bacterium]